MKKIITLFLFICSINLASFAQDIDSLLTSAAIDPADTAWKTGGTLGLNFSQTYLNNWAAGGQNAIAVNSLVSLFANYDLGNNTWDNTLDLAYGVLRQGEDGQFIKTDDRIDFASKYGRKATENWYYSVLLNFRSQFAPGYVIENGVELRDQKLSDFLSPAFSMLALGMDYKPSDNFTVLISPLTLKTTIVLDDELATDYGLEEGENMRYEIGGYIKIAYKVDVVENVTFQTRLDLFSNYFNNPQNIDVNWENLISMKINEFLSASITTQLIYDDDITIGAVEEVTSPEGDILVEADNGGPRTQFKEVLAIGVSYKF